MSLQLSLFLPPAGLFSSLPFCHSLSLSHPFSVLGVPPPLLFLTVPLFSAFIPQQTSSDAPSLLDTKSTSRLNLKTLCVF